MNWRRNSRVVATVDEVAKHGGTVVDIHRRGNSHVGVRWRLGEHEHLAVCSSSTANWDAEHAARRIVKHQARGLPPRSNFKPVGKKVAS
jgi:hypothetical protein